MKSIPKVPGKVYDAAKNGVVGAYNAGKANEYTKANLNNDDPVNRSRNEEAAARARKAVEDFKNGK